MAAKRRKRRKNIGAFAGRRQSMIFTIQVKCEMGYRSLAAKRRKRLKIRLNSWQKDVVWQKDEAVIIFLPIMFLPKSLAMACLRPPKLGCGFSALCLRALV